MAQHNEIEFEREICEYLAAHGWLYSPDDTGYDRERALFPEDFFEWLAQTQPDELAKVVQAGSAGEVKQREQVLDRLVKVLDQPLEHGGGTLNVLRGGFSHSNAKFSVCQFEPESTLNPKTVADHAAVRVRVMRQVYYSTASQRSVDLVCFINGLPVATLELKTDFTQTVTDAIDQYKKTRLPKDPKTGHVEPLFTPGARALVHFAVSNEEVWMTTTLAGAATRFLPFNLGTTDGGAGNPPNPSGSRTAYLWERVLERSSWLNIFGRFMYVKHESSMDPISGHTSKSSSLRFPRFHQWEVVNALSRAAATEGPGHRYLVQHSAGSGKTDSIAWTAHRLARLQVENSKVFDSVIVVTDRTVLDDQLRDAIKQLEGKEGTIAAIDRDAAALAGSSKSGLLAKALLDGKLIVVVTLQTFPYALEEIRTSTGLADKKFAVIADEAHSSQTGTAASKLKAVLTAEEQLDLDDGGEVDVEAVLAAEMADRAESPNISYFAFTATPKAKTLELFGRKPAGAGPDAMPEPFHIYSMKQAIEEGYILDVLHGYHSYKLAFRVGLNAAQEVEEVDQAEATKQVMRWVKLEAQTISQKSALIIEHFREQVAHRLEGHAKAMVVTDSRKAAVRYKLAIDKYIAAKGYGFGTIVAFSGAVTDLESGPEDFTESSMNKTAYGKPVGDVRRAFNEDAFQVMIVANKFQTGFDQPLLCAMYVDKQLSGVAAVQTLSRLNRTYVTPGGEKKTDATISVVDFVNDPDDIRAAFEPYYTDAHLETATDPNLVHDLASKLDYAGIYTPDEIEACAKVYIENQGNNALAAVLTPAKERFTDRYQAALANDDKGEVETLEMFRKDVASYVRLYDYLSQMLDYGDTMVEKRAIFLRHLAKLIRPDNYTAPINLDDLELRFVKPVDKGTTDISLGERTGLRGATATGSGVARDPKMVAFQQVLDRLNDLFGTEQFSDGQKVTFLQGLERTLRTDEALVQQAKVNTVKQFTESPDLTDAVIGAVADNQDAHTQIADFFYKDSVDRDALITDIARWFYKLITEEGAA